MRDDEKIVKSGGNIFADLGLPNADEEMAKAALALAVLRRIDARQLTQAQAAALMGTTPAKIAQLQWGKLSSFTVSQLERCLTLIVGLIAALLLPGCSRTHPQRSKIEAVSTQPNRAGSAAPIISQEAIKIIPAKPPPGVVYAAISPDGRVGASFYGSSKIRLWNTRTGKLLHTVKHELLNDAVFKNGSVEAIQFSRSGRWLLVKDVYSAAKNSLEPHHSANTLMVWNAWSGREVLTPTSDDDDSIRCVAFTPIDDMLVYDDIGKFGSSCTLHKVDLNANKHKELSLYSEANGINNGYQTALTPDGKTYSAYGFGANRMVDVATFKLMWTL